jgi:hypothetical protein
MQSASVRRSSRAGHARVHREPGHEADNLDELVQWLADYWLRRGRHLARAHGDEIRSRKADHTPREAFGVADLPPRTRDH